MDGVVNLADFDILKSNFGSGPRATKAEGDATGDGFVNLSDFDELKTTFGQSAGSAAVPEPSTWALLALGLIMLGFGRRRHL